MSKEKGISCGILIPIAVLVIVLITTGERWLLVPIGIMLIIFVADAFQNISIKKKRVEIDYWRAPESGTYVSGSVPELRSVDGKPIYDQKKQKEKGVTCGTLIPIIFVGWLFVISGSWIFLIPLACILSSLIDNITKGARGSSRIKEEMESDDVRTVSDISVRTGLPEDQIRDRIVAEKRSGSSDVWFDPSSGEITRTPIKVIEPAKTSIGCVYCGFALKAEDRFCPFCGAPIRAT